MCHKHIARFINENWKITCWQQGVISLPIYNQTAGT
jgi:hypothetical protein